MTITIAVDAMGGDVGAAVTVPACLSFLQRHGDVQLLLVGQPDVLTGELARAGAVNHPQIQVVPASQVVAMDEPPASALKNKRDSSMRIALNQVKHGAAQACVSAGNTGALMATARFVLKMLPGIERPAIASILPAVTGRTWVLDLGANVDCSAEQLYQFGLMGAMLVAAVEQLPAPTVGIINIGEEAIKGNEVVKQAAELLRASSLNFIGNVEGDGIYKGHADVIVCDGFVGNVLLKTSEGLAQMIGTFLREEFGRNLLTRLAAVMAIPVLKAFRRRFDHRRYNGAPLLGLQGLVIKSHGSADATSFGYALERALDGARNGVVARISQQLAASTAKATAPVA